MALTQDRRTDRREITNEHIGVAGGAKLFAGAMLAMDTDGYLVPAAATANLKVLGRCCDYVDNTAGADGAVLGRVEYGCYRWNNSASADEITKLHIGQIAFAVDDEQVALTDSAGARPAAGRIVWVDDRGVWVAMYPQLGMAENVGGAREVAEDAALTVAPPDTDVVLLSSTTGTKAATLTAMQNGQRLRVQLVARTGGSYTIAASLGATAGTVTLDATGEGVDLYKSGGTVKVLRLIGGATHA